MILSGLFFSILRCVGFHNCSRTTGTLRVAKTNTPCLEKNILAQKLLFGVPFILNFFTLRPLRALRLGSGILFDFSSCIYVVVRFSKITVPRLRRNILALNSDINLVKTSTPCLKENMFAQNVNPKRMLRFTKTNTPCFEKNILAQNFSFGKSFIFNFFSLRPLRALRLGSGILFDFSSSIYVVDRFSKITVPRLRKNILAQKLLFGVPFILNFFTLRPLRALRLSSGFLARGVIRGKNSFNIGACNV